MEEGKGCEGRRGDRRRQEETERRVRGHEGTRGDTRGHEGTRRGCEVRAVGIW